MAVAVSGNTLTDAWLADVDLLHHNGEQLNLVTTIQHPDPYECDIQVIEELDRLLVRRGMKRVRTVANTIFPKAFLCGCSSREELYERYRQNYPRLRQFSGNVRGTYFGRLIDYPATADVRRGETTNQIEGIIQKLQTQLHTGKPKRFAYQAQIFAPGRDDNTTMGFPCLSAVSFQLDDGRLCLTATYRNQRYFARALGNFIGLALLQHFVADEVELEMGSLTVHACHAELDEIGKRETMKLLEACKLESAPAQAA